MKYKHRRVLTGVLVCLAVYALAYGVARLRKCIVMHEYYVVKMPGVDVADPSNHVVRREVGKGRDIRTNWRGQLKNSINPLLFVVFKPCIIVETAVRGGDKKY